MPKMTVGDGDELVGEHPRRVVVRASEVVSDQWDVFQYETGGGRRVGDPLGMVCPGENGWDASLHTYTGVPAMLDVDYPTRDAATALFGVKPFRDAARQ